MDITNPLGKQIVSLSEEIHFPSKHFCFNIQPWYQIFQERFLCRLCITLTVYVYRGIYHADNFFSPILQ